MRYCGNPNCEEKFGNSVKFCDKDGFGTVGLTRKFLSKQKRIAFVGLAALIFSFAPSQADLSKTDSGRNGVLNVKESQNESSEKLYVNAQSEDLGKTIYDFGKELSMNLKNAGERWSSIEAQATMDWEAARKLAKERQIEETRKEYNRKAGLIAPRKHAEYKCNVNGKEVSFEAGDWNRLFLETQGPNGKVRFSSEIWKYYGENWGEKMYDLDDVSYRDPITGYTILGDSSPDFAKWEKTYRAILDARVKQVEEEREKIRSELVGQN